MPHNKPKSKLFLLAICIPTLERGNEGKIFFALSESSVVKNEILNGDYPTR